MTKYPKPNRSKISIINRLISEIFGYFGQHVTKRICIISLKRYGSYCLRAMVMYNVVSELCVHFLHALPTKTKRRAQRYKTVSIRWRQQCGYPDL